jgi:Phage terminase large subunit (GpA)
MIDLLANAIRENLKEFDTREIYEWAEGGNIVLPASYAMPGEFRVAPSRHLIEPFKAIKDPAVRHETVVKPVQSGGSLLADISVPWFVRNRPGPVMWNFHAENMAEDHARDRAIPVMKGCRDLQSILPRDPRKMGLHGAEFPHMTVYIQGATPSELQSKSIMLLINDELWRWAPGRYAWALARVTAFERVGMSKVLDISQAGNAGDDLDKNLKAGSNEEWENQCQSCDRHMFPELSGRRDDGSEWGMMWDTNERTRPGGKWSMAQVLPTVRFSCKHCGHVHLDSPRLKANWNLTGQYVARNPNAPRQRRSHRWSSISIDPWVGLVEQFLEAMDAYHLGIVDPLVSFKQQRLAECNDPERLHAGEQTKVETYDVVSDWPAEVVRGMKIDCQENCFWVEARQFASDGESRQLFFGKVSTEEEVRAKQIELKVPDNCTFADIGYSKKEKGTEVRRIYEMICRFNWCGLKGEDRDFYPHETITRSGARAFVNKLYSTAKWGDPQSGKVEQGRRFAKYFLWAKGPVNEIVKRLREGKGAKWVNPPDSKEHTRQLFAENKRQAINKKTGRLEWVWVQTRRDNHAFDLWGMFVVFCLMHPKIAFKTEFTLVGTCK